MRDNVPKYVVRELEGARFVASLTTSAFAALALWPAALIEGSGIVAGNTVETTDPFLRNINQ